MRQGKQFRSQHISQQASIDEGISRIGKFGWPDKCGMQQPVTGAIQQPFRVFRCLLWVGPGDGGPSYQQQRLPFSPFGSNVTLVKSFDLAEFLSALTNQSCPV